MMFSNVWLGPRPAQASPSDPLLAKVAVNPSSIASLNLQSGNTVTFQLNVTDAEPFGGFTVAIFFNNPVLRFQSLDYSGGVLGNDAFVSSECIDGAGSLCIFDETFDGQGVVSLSLFTSSGLNTNTLNGKLFRSDAEPFGGFTVAIFFNNPVLRFQSLDYSGGVLGNDAFVSSECIDGAGSLCIFDETFDGQGVVSLSLFTSSGLNTNTLNGKLF